MTYGHHNSHNMMRNKHRQVHVFDMCFHNYDVYQTGPDVAKTLFTLVFSAEFGARCFAYGINMFNWHNTATWRLQHIENGKYCKCFGFRFFPLRNLNPHPQNRSADEEIGWNIFDGILVLSSLVDETWQELGSLWDVSSWWFRDGTLLGAELYHDFISFIRIPSGSHG